MINLGSVGGFIGVVGRIGEQFSLTELEFGLGWPRSGIIIKATNVLLRTPSYCEKCD